MGKTPPSYIAVYFMAVGRALVLSRSGSWVVGTGKLFASTCEY